MNVIKLTTESPEIKYLCNKDKHLSKVISMIGPISYSLHDDYYAFLIHEIIEQMLSTKTAAQIFDRLCVLCNGNISPAAINQLSDLEIKSIGTSSSKVNTIRLLTNAVIDGSINLSALPELSVSEIISILTSVKGIGNWTAKMFLIFSMNELDVLLFEDAAFLQSYQWMYNTSNTDATAVKLKCKKWSPYSSIAARYLYRALDAGLTKEPFHLYK